MLSAPPRIIDKLGLLYIKDNKVLVARSRGKSRYYIPGGKRENSETDQEALVREISEELSVQLILDSLQMFDIFRAQADGKSPEEIVQVTCYQAEVHGTLQPGNEIEELRWVSYEDRHLCSPVTQQILEAAKQRNLIVEKPNTQLSLLSRYDWILFDADDTLFHFRSLPALQALFEKYHIQFTQQDFDEYQKLNKSLWESFQEQKITAKEIKVQRFAKWTEKLQIEPEVLNTEFLNEILAISTMLDGAKELLDNLKDKINIGIITNGFSDLQSRRLRKHDVFGHIDMLVISEEVGYAKPHPKIFQEALSRMGNPAPERVLMIGDSLQSDIHGALNVRMQTCWLNVEGKTIPAQNAPHYVIKSLNDLKNLLLGIAPSAPHADTNTILRRLNNPVFTQMQPRASVVVEEVKSKETNLLTPALATNSQILMPKPISKDESEEPLSGQRAGVKRSLSFS